MTLYANIATRSELLFRPESEELARRFFGDAVVDALPRFVRGKHKGAIKGMIRYDRVLKGGWVRTGNAAYGGKAPGYVEDRVGRIIKAEICTAPWGEEPEVLHTWNITAADLSFKSRTEGLVA
jgi:hypothetical protein